MLWESWTPSVAGCQLHIMSSDHGWQLCQIHTFRVYSGLKKGSMRWSGSPNRRQISWRWLHEREERRGGKGISEPVQTRGERRIPEVWLALADEAGSNVVG